MIYLYERIVHVHPADKLVRVITMRTSKNSILRTNLQDIFTCEYRRQAGRRYCHDIVCFSISSESSSQSEENS